MPAAPSTAWVTLLTNQHNTMKSGTPLASSESRWAGNVAATITGQVLGGVSSMPTRRIAFGGQTVETGVGDITSARPIRAPT